MIKMANFSFVWYSHTVYFPLDNYLGAYTPCKEPLEGDFRLKDAFQGGF